MPPISIHFASSVQCRMYAVQMITVEPRMICVVIFMSLCLKKEGANALICSRYNRKLIFVSIRILARVRQSMCPTRFRCHFVHPIS